MQALKRLVPNLFTAGNLVGGILAIIFTLTGKIELAPYCIFASALFDFLDGFMARLLKVPSELGKQLDSLADMVTFGVAPGIIVFVILSVHFIPGEYFGTLGESLISHKVSQTIIGGELLDQNAAQNGILDWAFLIPFIAFIIPVFALFRLAKFNLDTRQSDSFIGLPTPAMTLYFAVLPLLIIYSTESTDNWQVWATSHILLNPWFLSISSIVLSILMLVELPLFSLKFKHFKWIGNEVRFSFLTLCIIMLATLFFWAIPLIIILYVLLSIINNQFVKAKTNEI